MPLKRSPPPDRLPARTEMQQRLDPLIAERAPWLYSGRPPHTVARLLMMQLLQYPRSIGLAAEFRDLSTAEIMRRVQTLIVRDLRVEGLDAPLRLRTSQRLDTLPGEIVRFGVDAGQAIVLPPEKEPAAVAMA